jgi:hypothetical protein
MRIIIKGPNEQQYRLDLPGAGPADYDIVYRWLAHLFRPYEDRGPGPIPLYFTAEIYC